MVNDMRTKPLLVVLILVIVLNSITVIKADVLVDYSFDKKSIILTVNYGINSNDKPLILEVYVNRTLFRVYYFNENETFPKYIYINLKINGPTYISARTYNSITGWSKENEIYVNGSQYLTPEINLGREVALILGISILAIALVVYFRRKS
jgi:hypothetical protein